MLKSVITMLTKVILLFSQSFMPLFLGEKGEEIGSKFSNSEKQN